MAVKVLIVGESGTGKSTSLQNFAKDEVCYINPIRKELPFRGKFKESLRGETDINKVTRFILESKKKVIVIDDAQYTMAVQYMHRLKENGWDKYNDIQSDFFRLIDLADQLPEDTTMYFLSHIETKEDGRQKIKTIGKMLDEKITIEGLFTTVLKTYVSDGKYYFLTQNSGLDTVKSPIGLFPTFAIDNDLKYVDEKIRNYYELEGGKSDDEMQQLDDQVRNDELEKGAKGRVVKNKDGEGRTSRRSRAAAEDAEENKEETKPRRSRKTKVEEGDIKPIDEGDQPF